MKLKYLTLFLIISSFFLSTIITLNKNAVKNTLEISPVSLKSNFQKSFLQLKTHLKTKLKHKLVISTVEKFFHARKTQDGRKCSRNFIYQNIRYNQCIRVKSPDGKTTGAFIIKKKKIKTYIIKEKNGVI